MIPSTNTKLLVSEDWKKIYQSFRNADFTSYDFETLRRTMISYLQEKYPEEFNDYIDSSEYIALIDVIAYLGQNLSFRIDLNARENFLETAQRRDSILRLAQLISYNPTRNVPASGFLKFTAISTTDSVYDSNGTNLADTTIGWNDSTNPDWYQQFINIMNSAMPSNFGNPIDRKTIDSITTEQYKISSSTQDVPVFSFSKNINGTSMNFEVVPATFSGKDYVYEDTPTPANLFSIIYKNDNQGSGSANTGFFAHFKQGTINLSTFSIGNPVINEIIGINTPDINNTDTWLWQLDKNGKYSKLWTSVPSLVGNNVIYNSVNNGIRTLYAISSRDQDQIDLNFADGIFGDLPKGNFTFFYRQSNGLTYVIKPEQMSGISVTIPYFNAAGQSHSLTITLSLQYTVTNSAGAESNASIQTKAPQIYYTQNRMITGEDYNIAPLKAGADILKIKSVNRVSSGLSKYLDLSDVTGKYSNTNIFANDGILYKEETNNIFEFEFANKNQVVAVIKNTLAPILLLPELRSFYLNYYSSIDLSTFSLLWKEVNVLANESRGYFYINSQAQSVGGSGVLGYITNGAMIQFVAPFGKYFDSNNILKITPTAGIPTNGRSYIWATVKQVIGDGSYSGQGASSNGTGPIIFSIRVPDGCIAYTVVPKFNNILSYPIESEIANICITKKNFGLTIDATTREWSIILNSNLNLSATFSLFNQNNAEEVGLDASWLISFVWTGKQYKVNYRSVNYIFESNQETSFFVDNSSVNYDFTTNKVIKDKINILSINSLAISSTTGLGNDHPWQIDGAVIQSDGYVEPKKVKVSFYDYNNTGQLYDPTSFNTIVGTQFVYFEKTAGQPGYKLSNANIIPLANEFDFSIYKNTYGANDGDLFYFYDVSLNIVKYWSSTYQKLIYTDQFFGRNGRSDIKFHYQHNSGHERRIDPSKSNLIDIYVLTTTYDNDIRNWLLGNLSTEPLPPTSQGLEQNYMETLSPIKAISDEIVFHPVKYKVLFGSDAVSNLQAKFKAVKNPDRITTDNDLKTRILSAINDFFALENWEFGQSFHFGELSTYVMNMLTPDITNFIIVPITDTSAFGSLYEVTCLSNELFISSAKIKDIEIIDAITATQLRSSSSIITTSGS